MNSLRWLLLIVALLQAPLVQAVKVTNLYEAMVPVSDQLPENRSQAIRAALVSVLIKLTGNRNASEIYGVSELLKQADNFVRQYEYRSKQNEALQLTENYLWARFDSALLDKSMRDYNIPIWSQERPSTLVWMVVKDDLGQRFASLDEDSRYFSVLREQTAARGIPFMTPLHDLDDAIYIKTSDLLTNQSEPILQASERYQPDAILTAVITALPIGLWEAQWTSYIEGTPRSWTTSGDGIEIVISEGIDGLADNLAAHFAQSVGYAFESELEITVADVNSFDQYARSLSYLESLNFVTAVDVKQIQPGKVTYQLTARGGVQALSQAIILGDVLEPAGTVGEYRFIP